MKLMIEWTFEGGLKSVGEYGTSGTEPVINQECMLVHEKEDSTCQFEWYRDNNTYYYRLKQELEAVFFVLEHFSRKALVVLAQKRALLEKYSRAARD